MNSDLSCFALPPNLRYKLKKAGFTSLNDFLDIGPLDLSREACISKDEANDVLKLVNPKRYDGRENKVPVGVSAFELYQIEKNRGSITTFCQKLDEMLGGGIPLTKLTEICGAPGVGKTQMCLQLSTNVRIPTKFGGVGGECIYIDTEGSFTIQRLNQIATATVKHFHEVSDVHEIDGSSIADGGFTLENLLSGIHVYRCLDYCELIATVNLLDDILQNLSQVKLIIIDSIAFPFRNNFNDMALRTKLLNSMSQSLFQTAAKHKLAVVLTNQMTSKFDEKQCASLVPALGVSWGHVCTNRIVLSWIGHCRYANLYKSPSHKEEKVPFDVLTCGIRNHIKDKSESSSPPSKRIRT